MPRYLMTVVEPSVGEPPTPEALERIMTDVDAVHREMADAGIWVFGGGLHPPTTSTTLRPSDGDIRHPATADGQVQEQERRCAMVIPLSYPLFCRQSTNPHIAYHRQSRPVC